MRTLAIDPGSRRVGLAVSDEGGRFAAPYDVLQVRSPEEAIEPILALIGTENIARVIIGLPLNMDDTFGPAARGVRQWGDRLAARCGVPVLFVDERLSSFAAEQRLRERRTLGERISRQRRREMFDARAAAGFLQEFLDGKLPPFVPPES